METKKKNIGELALKKVEWVRTKFIGGSRQGFSFLPPQGLKWNNPNAIELLIKKCICISLTAPCMISQKCSNEMSVKHL